MLNAPLSCFYQVMPSGCKCGSWSVKPATTKHEPTLRQPYLLHIFCCNLTKLYAYLHHICVLDLFHTVSTMDNPWNNGLRLFWNLQNLGIPHKFDQLLLSFEHFLKILWYFVQAMKQTGNYQKPGFRHWHRKDSREGHLSTQVVMA